jgi:opacity protein-like surface antigen
MRHTTRSILLAAAMACSAATAAPLTEADITRNTACGAPGVGWRGVISGGTARIEARREPGQRVNAKGWWSPCKAHPVRDCPAMPSPSWIGAAGHYCRATQPTVPARDVGGEVELVTLPGIGNRGAHALQCQRQADGSAAWVVVRTRCGR